MPTQRRTTPKARKFRHKFDDNPDTKLRGGGERGLRPLPEKKINPDSPPEKAFLTYMFYKSLLTCTIHKFSFINLFAIINEAKKLFLR